MEIIRLTFGESDQEAKVIDHEHGNDRSLDDICCIAIEVFMGWGYKNIKL